MKFFKLGGIVLVGLSLALAGCGNNQSQSKSSSTQQSSQANMKNASSSSDNAVSASSSSAQSSSVPATNNYSFAGLTKKLAADLPNTALPTNPGINVGTKHVNIKYTGNSSNSTIYYVLGSNALPLNDSSINIGSAYAVFSKHTYPSATQAQAKINYTDQSNSQGLPKVNLVNKISAVKQSGAGQTYLQWNEGNWSIAVHGSDVNNTDPTSLAKQVANMFESYSLPAPNKYGSIQFEADQSGRSQKISWQSGNIVYTLTTTTPQIGIIMGSSIK
mgnify:CR=1 FL=1